MLTTATTFLQNILSQFRLYANALRLGDCDSSDAGNTSLRAGKWFSERSPMWPGQAQTLKIEEILYHKRSKYQDVLVFSSSAWGNVLCLDGCIQLCDKDEIAYQECIAHIPLFCHASPKEVLIIGGGDGGVIREALRHSSVEHVTLCEIDEMVIEVCQRYFPQVACSFTDPRVTLVTQDGCKFLEGKQTCYDVIIVDSSDPEGPASSLFGKEFVNRCQRCLRPDGVFCMQGENYWLHFELIEQMMNFLKSGFRSVEYATVQIPSYPSGCIGFFVCSAESRSCKRPLRVVPEHDRAFKGLKYYDGDIHTASFILPRFVKAKLKAAGLWNKE